MRVVRAGVLAVLAATAALFWVLPGAADAAGFVEAPGGPYPVGNEGISGIATGDLNGDGRTDVVTANVGLFGSPSYSVNGPITAPLEGPSPNADLELRPGVHDFGGQRANGGTGGTSSPTAPPRR
jgi:hypothetical protein